MVEFHDPYNSDLKEVMPFLLHLFHDTEQNHRVIVSLVASSVLFTITPLTHFMPPPLSVYTHWKHQKNGVSDIFRYFRKVSAAWNELHEGKYWQGARYHQINQRDISVEINFPYYQLATRKEAILEVLKNKLFTLLCLLSGYRSQSVQKENWQNCQCIFYPDRTPNTTRNC